MDGSIDIFIYPLYIYFGAHGRLYDRALATGSQVGKGALERPQRVVAPGDRVALVDERVLELSRERARGPRGARALRPCTRKGTQKMRNEARGWGTWWAWVSRPQDQTVDCSVAVSSVLVPRLVIRH